MAARSLRAGGALPGQLAAESPAPAKRAAGKAGRAQGTSGFYGRKPTANELQSRPGALFGWGPRGHSAPFLDLRPPDP